MLRFLFRCLGLLLLAAGFAALVVDGTRSIAANAIAASTLGDAAAWLAPARLAALQTAAAHVSPFLWDPALTTLLQIPAFLAAGILGWLILSAARRRAPKIGHSNR